MKKNKKQKIKKINIGLDLDGVIIDHTQNKVKIAKSLGFKIKKEETQSEILKNILPEDKYKKLQNIIYNKTTFFSPPEPFVFKILRELSRDATNEFFIISCRRGRGVDPAREWLEKHKIFKFVPSKNIFFVETEKEKNIYCQKLKIKIYLDDKVRILDMVSFVRYPIFYNPKKSLHNKKYLEIRSWKELPGLLATIKQSCRYL